MTVSALYEWQSGMNHFQQRMRVNKERKEKKEMRRTEIFFVLSHKVDKHSSTTYLCIDHNGLLGVGGGKY